MNYFGRGINLIKSFLNPLLSKDEYKRQGFLYFLSEAAVILMIALLGLNIIHFLFIDLKDILEILLLILMFFVIIYPASRYIWLGMEYGDVVDSSNYKRTRRKGAIQSVGTGLFFWFFLFIFKKYVDKEVDLFEVVMMTILFTLFHLSLTMISLRKSYKKNQSLEDE